VAAHINCQTGDTLSTPEGAHTGTGWVADPATPEDRLLSGGIVNRAEFNAAMSRLNKSDALIAVLASWLGGGPGMGSADLIITALLDNPQLRQGELADIIRVVRSSGHTSAAILSALCAHLRDDTPALTAVLWQASYKVNRDVAGVTGLLLPAVVCRVRRDTLDPDGMTGLNPTSEQQALIEATSASWAAWAGDDTTRASFLRDTSFSLGADCADLLEVGTALLAAQRPV